MIWVSIILSLISELPAIIDLIKKIADAINGGHPKAFSLQMGLNRTLTAYAMQHIDAKAAQHELLGLCGVHGVTVDLVAESPGHYAVSSASAPAEDVGDDFTAMVKRFREATNDFAEGLLSAARVLQPQAKKAKPCPK